MNAINRDPIETARRWLDEYERIALATVISTWGSAPVPVGGQLVIAQGERFEGSVSGGCVESDVIFEAAQVIASGKPKTLAYGVTDEIALKAGLPCGGEIEIFLEPLDAPRDAAYLDALLSARADRRPLVVRKNLADGARELFNGISAPEELAPVLSSGQSQVADTPEGRVFLHALAPSVRLIVAGATQLGQTLANMAALIGYNPIVVDPRSAFATDERFGAIERRVEWPVDALPAIGLDARTAVAAVTHAKDIDDGAIAMALRSPCFYIGALGSKRSHAARLERLSALGFGEADFARIRAPIGLDIGAKGPAEIAVSILAEIVRASRKP